VAVVAAVAGPGVFAVPGPGVPSVVVGHTMPVQQADKSIRSLHNYASSRKEKILPAILIVTELYYNTYH
jgi:hypothetical protein